MTPKIKICICPGCRSRMCFLTRNPGRDERRHHCTNCNREVMINV